METNNDYRLVPGVRNSFSAGWQVMMDNFLRLFLIVIILAVLTAPLKMFDFKFNFSDLDKLPFFGHNFDSMEKIFTLGSLGILAVFLGMLAMLYSFLVAPVFNYGGDMIFVQSV